MRRMIERGVFALIVAALLQVLIAPGAGASTRWCPKDPYIAVDGKLLHVWVASTYGIDGATMVQSASKFGVPTGTSRELISADDGFGLGYAVEFFESDEFTSTDQGRSGCRFRLRPRNERTTREGGSDDSRGWSPGVGDRSDE